MLKLDTNYILIQKTNKETDPTHRYYGKHSRNMRKSTFEKRKNKICSFHSLENILHLLLNLT